MPSVIRFNKERWAAEDVNLADVLDELPEPLAYFDASRRLSACNRSFRESFPVLLESEFVRRLEQHAMDKGHDGEIAWTQGQQVCSRGPLTEAAEAGWPRPRSNRHAMVPRARRTADGGTLVTYHDAAPMMEKEAQYRQTIDRLSDELTDALSAQRQAMQAARARKDVLVATSHELRTPLNAILGFSEILSSEMFGPLGHDRYREYARVIHDSGEHLLGLINDLLDYSKLDAGKLELRTGRVEILRVIVNCVRQIETQASKSQIGISVHVYDGVTGLVGDDKRIHQMLLNLLSNAVKFTPERGEVSVDVFRRADFIGISVSDTGIGIKAEDIPRVLEPFGQVDSELARKHQGTGLGLPLTKELAELHGGSMVMESAVDAGTTITLLLPEDATAAAETSEKAGAADEGVKTE
jgi:signal transduction histidine kinase